MHIPAKLYWDTEYESLLALQHQLSDTHVQYWMHHSFPKWTWWFLLFWTIVPLFVWWKYTDRSCFLEICFFGILAA